MPCRDYGDPGTYPYEQVKAKLDKVTKLLCWLCTRSDSDLIRSNLELYNWWESHKYQDRRRKAAEAAVRRRKEAREAVIRKLTKEERILLGIKDK